MPHHDSSGNESKHSSRSNENRERARAGQHKKTGTTGKRKAAAAQVDEAGQSPCKNEKKKQSKSSSKKKGSKAGVSATEKSTAAVKISWSTSTHDLQSLCSLGGDLAECALNLFEKNADNIRGADKGNKNSGENKIAVWQRE